MGDDSSRVRELELERERLQLERDNLQLEAEKEKLRLQLEKDNLKMKIEKDKMKLEKDKLKLDKENLKLKLEKANLKLQKQSASMGSDSSRVRELELEREKLQLQKERAEAVARTRQLELEHEREKARSISQQNTGDNPFVVQQKVQKFHAAKSKEYESANCQIIKNQDFNMDRGAEEISGALYSLIEESFPFESENNTKWLIQQIIHGVGGAYSGLPQPNKQIAETCQKTSIQGDELRIEVRIQSYVYGKSGEWLNTENINQMSLRILVGINYVKNTKRMSPRTIEILSRKEGLQREHEETQYI